MRTKWTVLLWMLMISGLLAAQNTANTSFQVKGILLDSLTQEGEPYATIKIVKKEAPAKALKMLVTDMKGQFQEKVPGTGNFVMTITSVGRTPIVKDFSVKAGEKLVDFGTLYIVDASNELGQVEILAYLDGFQPLVDPVLGIAFAMVVFQHPVDALFRVVDLLQPFAGKRREPQLERLGLRREPDHIVCVDNVSF